MSEFQLSLLTIGLIVVIGVYLYGFWQQLRYRRSQGEIFKAQSTERSGQEATIGAHATDAKFDDERDPMLGLEGDFSNSTADDICNLLNDATDYVANFRSRHRKHHTRWRLYGSAVSILARAFMLAVSATVTVNGND